MRRWGEQTHSASCPLRRLRRHLRKGEDLNVGNRTSPKGFLFEGSQAMRYYFQLSDGHVLTDDEGEVFEDLDAAKVEAARIAGEWLRDNADEFAQDGALLIEVLDEPPRRTGDHRRRGRRPDGDDALKLGPPLGGGPRRRLSQQPVADHLVLRVEIALLGQVGDRPVVEDHRAHAASGDLHGVGVAVAVGVDVLEAGLQQLVDQVIQHARTLAGPRISNRPPSWSRSGVTMWSSPGLKSVMWSVLGQQAEDEVVGSRPAGQQVIAQTAVQRVAAGSAVQPVIAQPRRRGGPSRRRR